MRVALPGVRVSGWLPRVRQRWIATARREARLLIEGKRTESLSESTAWYAGRNQLHRNLEAARRACPRPQFGVLIIGEEPLPDAALGNAMIGLPHLPERERADLMGTIWVHHVEAGLPGNRDRFRLVATECRSSDESEEIVPAPGSWRNPHAERRRERFRNSLDTGNWA